MNKIIKAWRTINADKTSKGARDLSLAVRPEHQMQLKKIKKEERQWLK